MLGNTKTSRVVLPKIYLSGREYNHDFGANKCRGKVVYGAHKDRLATYQSKLLW
jgi:hypothetical protein